MPVLIDTHIHVYPEYDVRLMFQAFRDNIIRSKSQAGVMMLTERAGIDVFGMWKHGRNLPEDIAAVRSDDTSVVLHSHGLPDIIAIAGSQTACRERIEVLALGTTVRWEDGIKVSDAVREAAAAGALPVLAWGLGKWMFSRAKIVKRLLSEFLPDVLLIGDTSLRPAFLPAPAAMRRAASEGRIIIAGSDPLPNPDEAIVAGQYAERYDGKFDYNSPLAPQIISVLKSGKTKRFGRRASAADILRRAVLMPVRSNT